MDKQPVQEIKLSKIEVRDLKEKLSSNKNYVYWGETNNFCDYLITLLNNSPTHGGIISKRVNMTIGDGFVIDVTTQKNEKETEKFINCVNKYDESLEDICYKIIYDYVVFGFACIQVMWGPVPIDDQGNYIDGDDPYVAELYHIPADKVRFGAKDKNSFINSYFLSKDWKKAKDYKGKDKKEDEYTPIPIRAFSSNKEIVDNFPTQLMVIKSYTPGLEYYTFPGYLKSCNWIENEYQISEFALNSVRNGFFPNVIIQLSNVNEDEQDYIVKSFENQYTGTPNTSKPVFLFPEGENQLTITNLDVSTYENLIQILATMSKKNIQSVHSINPILAGDSESGSLGDGKEINNAYLMYELTIIKPDQKAILSNLNKIMRINRLDNLKFSTSTPIPFTADSDMMSNSLTIDEIREMEGATKLDKEEYINLASVVIARLSAAQKNN